MRWVALALALWLGSCASRPQLVMVNPQTGATVGCQVPDTSGDSADFLVSRACISACQAHGFRAMPGVQAASGGDVTPSVCQK